MDEWHATITRGSQALRGELQAALRLWQNRQPSARRPDHGRVVRPKRRRRCMTIEEVVEKSDYLLVLSPDNCEMHEELCQLPLRSGKRTYVDKTFAPDLAAAQRLFAIARQSGTPCYSTSALRFAEEYRDVRPDEVTAVSCWGPNDFDTYSVHQLEPLMMLMGADPVRVMWLDGEKWMSLAVQFRDGRCATLSCFAGGSPFVTNVSLRSGNRLITVQSVSSPRLLRNSAAFIRPGRYVYRIGKPWRLWRCAAPVCWRPKPPASGWMYRPWKTLPIYELPPRIPLETAGIRGAFFPNASGGFRHKRPLERAR